MKGRAGEPRPAHVRQESRKTSDTSVKRPSTALVGPVSRPAETGPRCLVCAEPADALICVGCKARIQGEALERKREEQRFRPE